MPSYTHLRLQLITTHTKVLPQLCLCMISILSSSWRKNQIYWWKIICQESWMTWIWDMSNWSNWIHLWYTVPLLALGRLDLMQRELDMMLLRLLLLGWCTSLGRRYDCFGYDVFRDPIYFSLLLIIKYSWTSTRQTLSRDCYLELSLFIGWWPCKGGCSNDRPFHWSLCSWCNNGCTDEQIQHWEGSKYPVQLALFTGK